MKTFLGFGNKEMLPLLKVTCPNKKKAAILYTTVSYQDIYF